MSTTTYQKKLVRLRPSELEAYWPLDDESGTSPRNLAPGKASGATSSGLVRIPATRGFTGPDGGRCAEFDGAASTIDIYTAVAAASTITCAEGTMSVWVAVPQVNLSGTTRLQVMVVGADTANTIGIDLDTTAYRFSADYFAGAADATYSTTYGKLVYNVDGGVQKPEWHHLALTYSVANDSVVLWVDGTASTGASSLGTWTGAYDDTICNLGTSNSAADYFKGWMAHAAFWSTPLTGDEVKVLANAGP